MRSQGKGARGGSAGKEEGGQGAGGSSSAELAKQLAALQVAASTSSGARTVQVRAPRPRWPRIPLGFPQGAGLAGRDVGSPPIYLRAVRLWQRAGLRRRAAVRCERWTKF